MGKLFKSFRNNRFIKYIFFIITAFFFVKGISNYFFSGNLLGIESILNWFLFGSVILIMHYGNAYITKRNFFCFFSLSFILSVTMIFGRPIYLYGSMEKFFFPTSQLFFNIVYIFAFSLVFYSIFILFEHHLSRINLHSNKRTWKLFKYPPFLIAFIFLAWIPCYLSYYPGTFAYDMIPQNQEAMGLIPLSKYHPPIHTLFWRFCLFLEQNLNINALVFYSIVQMLLLATAFTYVVIFLAKRKFNNWIILATLLFFALNPVIAIFSFIPTKDAMYSAFCVLFMIELLNLISSNTATLKESRWNIIRVIVFGTLSCLFRNNMIYALVPSAVIVCFTLKKGRKKLIISFASIVATFWIISSPVFTLFNIEEGNKRELLSVPIQQISYVVNHYSEQLSPEDYEDISKYLPVDEIPQIYNLRFADPVKIEFNDAYFEEDSATFFKVWYRLLLQYPDEYINAFLNLNLPYWYPDACSVDEYSNRMYIETFISDISLSGYNVERETKIPWLYEKYEEIASYQKFIDKPLISNIFSISTPIWILLFYITLCLYRKDYTLTAPATIMLFVWLTFIIGPVSNFRYMFPIIVLYPLFISVILQPQALKNKNN